VAGVSGCTIMNIEDKSGQRKEDRNYGSRHSRYPCGLRRLRRGNRGERKASKDAILWEVIAIVQTQQLMKPSA